MELANGFLEVGNRRVPLFVWLEIAEKETGVGEDEDEQTGPRILVEGLFSLCCAFPNKTGKKGTSPFSGSPSFVSIRLRPLCSPDPRG